MENVAQAVWIDPTGAEWLLTDTGDGTGWFTTDAVSGLGALPVELTTDPSPRGGSVFRHAQSGERIITWPLHIFGSTHIQFITRFRQLVDAFTSTDELGPGKLVIYRPDGTGRVIPAYYQGGFDGEPGRGFLHDDVVLSLLCPAPWFYDLEPVTVYRAYASSGSFLAPFPNVSPSTLLGESEVYNPGGVMAWPEWRITGPATLITATNLTTGQQWQLDPDAPGLGHGPLLEGETITLKTETMQVRGPNGTDIWTAAINFPDSVLWGLRRGSNIIDFDVQGAATGTAVEMTYYPKYRAA